MVHPWRKQGVQDIFLGAPPPSDDDSPRMDHDATVGASTAQQQLATARVQAQAALQAAPRSQPWNGPVQHGVRRGSGLPSQPKAKTPMQKLAQLLEAMSRDPKYDGDPRLPMALDIAKGGRAADRGAGHF